MDVNKEKVLSVGEIFKSSSCYGNYYFKIEVIKKGLNGLYKTELSIFDWLKKGIEIKRNKYLSLINKEVKKWMMK